MTCIVGLEHDGRVYIGGDSAGISGWSLTVRADEKVFTTGPFIMGFTTSFRMGQLLRYRLAVDPQPEGEDDLCYLATTFIDTVRQVLKDGGYTTIDKGEESGGEFLVGYRGGLYKVCKDFQIGRSAHGYAAVGCGADLAVGAMYASWDVDDPMQRLTIALDAADAHSAGVCGPYVITAR